MRARHAAVALALLAACGPAPEPEWEGAAAIATMKRTCAGRAAALLGSTDLAVYAVRPEAEGYVATGRVPAEGPRFAIFECTLDAAGRFVGIARE